MQIDVITGSPPFYTNGDIIDGHDKNEVYATFIDRCLKICKRYLAMITPNKWLVSKNHIDWFRAKMFNSDNIKEMHIYNKLYCMFDKFELKDLCYFLYDKNSKSKCKVISHPDNVITHRDLKQRKKFLESNIAESIIQKAEALAIKSNLRELVLSKSAYGLPADIFYQSAYHGLPFTQLEQFNNCITIIGEEADGTISEQFIPKNYPFKDSENTLMSYKIFIPKTIKKSEYFNVIQANEMWICTDSFWVAGPFNSSIEALNYMLYLNSKAVDFIVFSQLDSSRVSLELLSKIPLPKIDKIFDDNDIYKFLGLTEKEIKYIEDKY